jgi:hypothetical protein
VILLEAATGVEEMPEVDLTAAAEAGANKGEVHGAWRFEQP